jgi:DNA invertase Pin-like site-specific DNA recombinase
MIVAGYIAVPSRGRSLPADEQRAIVEALAASKGLGAISRCYSEPESPGDTSFADRSGGATALQELSEGDALLVARMDCLGDRARTIRDALKVIRAPGIRLVISDFFGQQFDGADALSGDAFTVLDGFVAYQKSRHGKRASRAFAERRAIGLRASPLPPPGKRHVRVGTQGNGRPIVAVENDPNDQRWIEAACREYMLGKTERQVLAILNKAGARTNLGRQWTKSRLHDIIVAQGGRRGMLSALPKGEG